MLSLLPTLPRRLLRRPRCYSCRRRRSIAFEEHKHGLCRRRPVSHNRCVSNRQWSNGTQQAVCINLVTGAKRHQGLVGACSACPPRETPCGHGVVRVESNCSEWQSPVATAGIWLLLWTWIFCWMDRNLLTFNVVLGSRRGMSGGREELVEGRRRRRSALSSSRVG